jgi:hypothetical protein
VKLSSASVSFASALCAAALSWAGAARAIDPFEIQVYDGTANRPGAPGLELHLNTIPSGNRQAEPPELPQHHQTHVTFEPSLGVTRFWELGGYLQTALLGDGSLRYAGAKLRSKFVWPSEPRDHLRLGLNIELSLLPRAFEVGRWGSELRPIVAWEDERVILGFNPIFDTALAGPEFRAGPSFEPAAMAKLKIQPSVALGLEYYGSVGPIADPAPLAEQRHYLFEVFDLLGVERFELNAGVGEGLTSSSNAFVIKAIVGYVWDTE